MAKTALIIGDSHVEPMGSFGQALAAKLKAQGYDVTIAGVGSSNAYMWSTQSTVCRPDKSWCVDTTKLPKNPDLLVISLGTNDAANAAAGGRAVSTVPPAMKQIIAHYAPKKWFWIGPPATRDGAVQYYTTAAIAKFYAAVDASGMSIFDSRPATQAAVAAGSGDGVHLGPAGAQTWAAAAASAIASSGNTLKVVAVLGTIAAAATLAVLWRKGYLR